MCPTNRRAHRARTHCGLTLIELVIAIAIMAFMTAALGALSHAVQVASDYNEGASTSTQHARVAHERIARAVSKAFANENFPGAAVFFEQVDSYTYPDTLVLWYPTATPVNPSGLPQFNEIVAFAPNPSAPNELLEITAPTDTRTVPALSDLTSWATELTNLKTQAGSQKVLLTDLVKRSRTSLSMPQRGSVRFDVELRPSESQWASYRAATTTFVSLPWVQSISSRETGLRQTQVRSELQLVPGYNVTNDWSTVANGFFGSAALNWTVLP